MLANLLKIRISIIGLTLLAFYLVLLQISPQLKLTPGQLALFSVNSFLFGYYFAPMLSAQKARVAALITAVRQEEMAVLDILTQSHLLSKSARHHLKVKLRVYLESVIGNTKVRADNPYYDELLYYTKKATGEDETVMNVIYDRVAKTQANRDTMNNLFASKVYSHEWLVGSVLFAITLFFALQTDYNHLWFFSIMLAILCTGLSLLMVILVKFATLTHKEAKRMWVPLNELLVNHFEDITPAEAKAEKTRIDERVQAAK